MTLGLTMLQHQKQTRRRDELNFDAPDETPKPPTRAEIEAQLNALGHVAPWTPALDLALVNALRSGSGLPGAAHEVGTTPEQARSRWHDLMLDTSLTTQAITHEALRRRAMVPA